LTIAIDPVFGDLKKENGESRRNYPGPFSLDYLPHIDYVFVTHDHADHLDRELIKRNVDAVYIVPEAIRDEVICLGVPGRNVIGLRQDEKREISPSFEITPIAAEHEEYEYDKDGNSTCLSYFVSLGGMTFFHSGDTYLTEKYVSDVKALGKVDVALLSMNGTSFSRHRLGIKGNMNADEAAWLSNEINAGLSIPMHYDMVIGNGADPLSFIASMRESYPRRKAHVMALGEMLVVSKRRG